MFIMCFGIRREPPCSDCWPDGQCSMNCGPAVKVEYPDRPRPSPALVRKVRARKEAKGAVE